MSSIYTTHIFTTFISSSEISERQRSHEEKGQRHPWNVRLARAICARPEVKHLDDEALSTRENESLPGPMFISISPNLESSVYPPRSKPKLHNRNNHGCVRVGDSPQSCVNFAGDTVAALWGQELGSFFLLCSRDSSRISYNCRGGSVLGVT